MADLTAGLVVLGCCVVGKAACAWAEMWVAHDLAYRIMIDARGEVFDGLERLAPGWLLGKRTGDLAAAALTDVEEGDAGGYGGSGIRNMSAVQNHRILVTSPNATTGNSPAARNRGC